MNHYLENILLCSKRLVNLIDGNDLSSTRGSFDRNFWHFKTRSFSNAALQQGMLGLAKLYTLDSSDNKFYQSSRILHLIEYSIEFSTKIQNSDGSFDEWYPNERGAAGPTGYLCHAFCDTYYLLKEFLSHNAKEKLLSLIKSSATFLTKSNEKHPLANHVAIAMLGIYEAYDITGNTTFLNTYNELKDELFSLFIEDEGWSIEYDGADPGYQTASVSFLSRIHKINQCNDIKRFCEKSVEFIEAFCFPDGSFSGNIGSRHTTNIFYFGIEYWSENTNAQRISNWIKDNFVIHSRPSDHDDIYFIYRVHELIDAYTYYKECSSDEISYSSREFKRAGIKSICINDLYLVVNLKRGACFKAFDIKESRLIDCDSGAYVKIGKKSYSSLFMNEVGEGFTIQKKLVNNSPKTFTPLKQILFFSFMLIFGNNYKLARYIKYLIRSILIVFSKESDVEFIRSFEFLDDQIKITSSINGPIQLDQVLIGGEHFSRYVPQSRYYHEPRFINKYQLNLKNTTKAHVTKIIELSSKEVSIH